MAGGFNGSFDPVGPSEIYDSLNGTWQLTGAMQISRQTAATVLLSNGKVLAAGGFGNRNFLASAELYEPATSQWAFTGSMHDLRWGASAVVLRNGKVLVAGGADNVNSFQSSVRTAELYDPTTGNWSVTGSMAQERHSFTLTLLSDGNVIAAGGFGTNGPVASADIYEPSTGIWAPTRPLNISRSSHTATLLPNGKVLVAGGLGATPVQSPGSPPDSDLTSAELFDLATGEWTLTGSMGQPRQTHTATLLPDGRVLVAGGQSYYGGVYPTGAEFVRPRNGSLAANSAVG